MPKITPFLWFDKQAEEAANFYVSVFPNSKITAISRYPADTPPEVGTPGGAMTVAFQLDGLGYTALNGGPHFRFDQAVSFVVDCADQDEVDRYWSALTADGGQEIQCGWLKDKYGLPWQVVPRQFFEMIADPDPAKVGRVFTAMMGMVKFDVAKLRAAYEGALDA